ncbi:hypothetical protein BKA58DRAFT_117581 [Alternaria rosae]|uniref:uncharacterized protein n=1 Tax=Alternaria rosae TaxID=1187941 RepID=UPI001E8E181F|nr:uncharacterized protein BKA58DRAFT_117581 [Alternaria rosae]KAH6875216.1 hypothetical protein BKA58DRAFT_117581 [Alternaria rosae]
MRNSINRQLLRVPTTPIIDTKNLISIKESNIFSQTVMTEQKIIAIIGSTGFLGPYITASLLQKHPNANILCLNRSKDAEQRTTSSLSRISNDDLTRLTFITADITLPNLGLDLIQYTHFKTSVSEIVFNAWNANWTTPLIGYLPLLNAVQHVITACTASPQTPQPRITFISSNTSIMNHPTQHPSTALIPEVPAWDFSSAANTGYGQSKCLAEQLLARAGQEHRVRVAIVRAGQIGGASSALPEAPQWPIQGWLYVTFKTAQTLGYWPVRMNAVDWIPVNSLAEGIANITLSPPSSDAHTDTVKVYNMMHPRPAPWVLLQKVLVERFGLEVKECSLPQWLGMLDSEKFKMHAFLMEAGEGREDEALVFGNENAREVLPEVEDVTEGLVERWLMGWGLRLREVRARL